MKKWLQITFVFSAIWGGNISSILAQKLEIPQTSNSENITIHEGFSTSYHHGHGQPQWVAYEINSKRLISISERASRFTPDPKIKPSTTPHEAYTKTGFDRGHLAPAADMAWSDASMTESFYTSNVCPQRPSFNRGIWKNLESKIRDWAKTPHPSGKMPVLFIVTGPIFTENMINISRNPQQKLSVPEYFFKALVDTVDGYRAIGFIIPNEKFESSKLKSFALSIDELESKIGRDLFPLLEDAIEEKIESQLLLKKWSWN